MKHIIPLIILASYIPFVVDAQSNPEPRELTDLRGSFEKARTAALSPLEKKYVDALTGLKDRLTKRGDLQGALAVQSELSRMQPASAKPSVNDGKLRLSKLKTTDEFFGWLSTTAWKSPTGNTLRFPRADEMELTSPEGRKSTYALTIEKVGELSWVFSNGNKELMQISSDLDSATCSTGVMKRIESP